MKRLWGSLFVGLIVPFLFAPVSEASSVAYLDKGGVWVSSLDGKQKRKIAGKPAGKSRWRELAQSDNGRIIAVRREPDRIATLNRFSLWGPTGKQVFQGMLGAEPGWTSYAFPVGLDLTSDGRTVVYGYSNMNYGFPVSTLETGTYVLYADRHQSRPFKITDQEWPTAVGKRLVTASDDVLVSVQRGTGQPPYQEKFKLWFSIDGTGLELQRTDVAASKRVAGAEMVSWNSGKRKVSVIAMSRANGLGGQLGSGTCLLPTRGLAENVTISQDGRTVAWQDRRGVMVSGVPTFRGSDVCKLTRKARVISKSGSFPSIGAAKVKVRKRR